MVCSLRVVPVSVWVLSRCSGILPQSRHMHFGGRVNLVNAGTNGCWFYLLVQCAGDSSRFLFITFGFCMNTSERFPTLSFEV